MSSHAAPPIRASLTATGELWRTVSGGLQVGTRWNTLVDFSVELDTGSLGAWRDGAFVAQVHWVENQESDPCVGDYAGAVNPISGLMAADHLRVFNLHYRHAWAGGTRSLKIGLLAIDDDFMASDYAGLFANSAFGAMPSQVATPLAASCLNTPAVPIYAVAAPGLWFSAQASEAACFQAGLYHGGPGPDTRENHGFDWETDADAGAVVFVEGSYSFALAGRASTVRVGGSYHTGVFDNYAGMVAGDAGATVRGLCSFYAIQDLVLAADAAGEPRLAAFARAGIGPQQDRSVVTSYADAGVNWFAPLSWRKGDIAGAAVSTTRFGRDFRRSNGDGLAAAETTFEATYRAQLTAWLAAQLDLQLLFNPARRPDSDSRETATVCGLRVEASF